jgi:hypothetical protein
MIVVLHQTVSVADPAVTGNDPGERLKKKLAVGLGEKDPLPSVTPTGQMIDGTGKFQSKRSRHEKLVSTEMLDCKT